MTKLPLLAAAAAVGLKLTTIWLNAQFQEAALTRWLSALSLMDRLPVWASRAVADLFFDPRRIGPPQTEVWLLNTLWLGVTALQWFAVGKIFVWLSTRRAESNASPTPTNP